jgi:hypothetical protein
VKTATTATVRLPAQEVRVCKEVDVLVVGGGPAGFAAAVSAGRLGARTLLVERFGYLGGMWTAGLVNPYFDVRGKGGLNEEILKRLKSTGGWGGLWDAAFDPNAMKLLLDDLVEEAGAELLLYALGTEPIVQEGVIRGMITESKSGRLAILAKQVIDCTGDGDVAARCGAPFQQGRYRDGLMQPMTMMFRVAGLASAYPVNEIRAWYDKLKRAVPEAEILQSIPYDRPAVIALPCPGEAVIQWTHLVRMCGTDAWDLTRATLAGRKQVRRALELLRKVEAEVGALRLLELPVAIGVRETRRIEGEYSLTLEDLLSGRRFSDGICLARFNVDIHDPEGQRQTRMEVKPYHIPYRALVPKKVENLLVAGRCISGSHEAHASYRVTGNCVSTGEAAGTAAALALQLGLTPRELSGATVAEHLRRGGVKLE